MTTGSVFLNGSNIKSIPDVGEATSSYSYQKVWFGKDGRHNWCNDYDMSKSKETRQPVLLSISSAGSGWQPHRYFTMEAPGLSGFLPVHEQKELDLFNKLAENVKGNSFDPALAFAELDRTSSHLGDTARDLAAAASFASRGKYRQAIGVLLDRKTLPPPPKKRRISGHGYAYQKSKASNYKPSSSKAISDKYLEWQFAWKPLIDDITDAAEMYAAATHYTNNSKVYATDKMLISQKHEHGQYSNEWHGKIVSAWQTRFASPIPLSGIRNQTRDDQMLSLIIQAARVGWERTWLSFVIDWFLNIGDSLTAMQNLEVVGGRVMRTDILKEQSSLDSFWIDNDLYSQNGSYHGLYVTEGKIEKSAFMFRRREKEWSIFGILHDYLTSYDTGFSPTHLIEGLALLRQFAGGDGAKSKRF